jgi:hypothetical protein
VIVSAKRGGGISFCGLCVRSCVEDFVMYLHRACIFAKLDHHTQQLPTIELGWMAYDVCSRCLYFSYNSFTISHGVSTPLNGQFEIQYMRA